MDILQENEIFDCITGNKRLNDLCEALDGNNIDGPYTELMIAAELQHSIGNLPIASTYEFNCLPSNLLASNFLTSVGIKHYFALQTGHVSLILQTSDNNLHWRDFTPSIGIIDNQTIEQDNFIDRQTWGKLADENQILRDINIKLKYKENTKITIYPSNIGQQFLYLHNVAFDHLVKGRRDEAKLVYRQIHRIDPENTSALKIIEQL